MHGVRAGRQAVTTEMFRDAVRQTCDDLIEGETGRDHNLLVIDLTGLTARHVSVFSWR